jgi:hypothetical protein
LEDDGATEPSERTGSASYHCILGPLGAAVLAEEQGIGVADLGDRRATTLAIAHHLRLPELIRGKGFFAAGGLCPAAMLTRSWRCGGRRGAARPPGGAHLQPHGFGRWQQHGAVLDFFLVCDNAADAPSRMTTALAGYQQLARANLRLATVTLLWTTCGCRESRLWR